MRAVSVAFSVALPSAGNFIWTITVPSGTVLADGSGIVQLVADAATTGQLAGRVVDDGGVPLPGVSVTASSPTQIGGVRSTQTDAQGWFQYPRLNPGYFTVRLELEGFLTQELTEVQVRLDRMTRLLDSLTNFSEKRPADDKRTNLGTLLPGLIKIIRASLSQGAGIDLDLQLEAGLPMVSISPDSLKQVLINLIINAEQAADLYRYVEANRKGFAIIAGDFNAQDDEPQIMFT